MSIDHSGTCLEPMHEGDDRPSEVLGVVMPFVVAIGWHCFSFHCKFVDTTQTPAFCRKHEKLCQLDNCKIFRNGRPV